MVDVYPKAAHTGMGVGEVDLADPLEVGHLLVIHQRLRRLPALGGSHPGELCLDEAPAEPDAGGRARLDVKVGALLLDYLPQEVEDGRRGGGRGLWRLEGVQLGFGMDVAVLPFVARGTRVGAPPDLCRVGILPA